MIVLPAWTDTQEGNRVENYDRNKEIENDYEFLYR